MPGDQLDISSDPERQKSGTLRSSRRFLGVHFACCGRYVRVYVNCDETAYVGHCPQCSRPVRLQIGRDGTNARFFTAY